MLSDVMESGVSDREDSFLLKIAHAPAVSSHPTILVGTVIAERFRIEALAGTGGMGAVYRSVDLATGAPVAIKVLARDGARGVAERFVREGELLSTLSHPNIVRWIAHGLTSRGDPYLAMEWLDGEELASRLQDGALTIHESITLVSRVVAALKSAHDRGVLHRDVKPQNIFLVEGDLNRPKVLDFGLARPSAGMTPMTNPGAAVGTPAYMSPEQARNAPVLDERVDVFGLGCTLFECLCGRPPFTARDVPSLLRKILFEEPPRVSSLRPEVPDPLDWLVSRMLAKDPAMRLSLDEVAAAMADAAR